MQKAITAASILSFGGIVFIFLSLAADSANGRHAFDIILTASSVLFLSSGAVGILAFIFGQQSQPLVQLAGIRILWVVSIPLFGLLALLAGFGGLEFAALTAR